MTDKWIAYELANELMTIDIQDFHLYLSEATQNLFQTMQCKLFLGA